MSYFKAKMHQIRFRLVLRSRPRWGSLQRSPRTPSWIQGDLLLRGGTGKEGGDGRGGEGKGGGEQEGRGRGPEWRGEGGKGKGEGVRMDRGMGKDNGDRSPTIFGLKVALPKADILNSYGKLICVNNKEIASVYFFQDFCFGGVMDKLGVQDFRSARLELINVGICGLMNKAVSA